MKNIENAIPHVVLDLSIKDIGDRWNNAKVYPTLTKAADFLGLATHTVVMHYADRVIGKDGKMYVARPFNQTLKTTKENYDKIHRGRDKRRNGKTPANEHV